MKRKVMTWATFKRKYKPEMYSYTDNIFGTVSTIKPTMRNCGFKTSDYDIPFSDIDIKSKVLELAPQSAVFIVYYVWVHRDSSGRSVSIFYKTDKDEMPVLPIDKIPS